MLINDMEIKDSTGGDDDTLLILASHGDSESMVKLIKKYHGAIHGAAMKYSTSYGYEDCFSAARLAFIERVSTADPLNVRKFRTMIRQELADSVFGQLNPYGLTRRGAEKLGDSLFCETKLEGSVEIMAVKSDKPLSRHMTALMEKTVNEEERLAIMGMLDHPIDTPEKWIAEDLGLSRDTYRRRLASGLTKMRVAMSGAENE